MTFGIIGSGSWATALAKILTDRKHSINWWIRNKNAIDYIVKNNNNPNYLRSAKFDISLLTMSAKIEDVVAQSNVLVVAVPS
ncbi:MAG: NAD(P)-binding domain-containing protein, partial [Chitinophagaceae bacterium]